MVEEMRYIWNTICIMHYCIILICNIINNKSEWSVNIYVIIVVVKYGQNCKVNHLIYSF